MKTLSKEVPMYASHEFELKIFDRTLLTFRFVNGFTKETEIMNFDRSAFPVFPLGLSLTNEGLYNWLDNRIVPAQRTYMNRICEAVGVNRGDLEAFYRLGLGLSLTDSYWIVPKGFEGRFGELNLFENRFSDALGSIACTGHVAAPGSIHGLTPDLVTDGTLPKAWRIVEDGTRCLYKGHSEGSRPGEPLSEFMASQIGEAMGIGNVHYDLDFWDASQAALCSVCPAFTSKDVSYVPFAVATGTNNALAVFRYAAALGDSEFERLCSMLSFDALICNTDRHYTNFGFLRDNHTGRLLGFAPVFDNGRSLFFNKKENDPEVFRVTERFEESIINGGTFEELIASTVGVEQQRQLGELADFRFELDPFEAYETERYAAIEDFIRQRADDFLKLKPVDHDEILSAAMKRYSEPPAQGEVVFRKSVVEIEKERISNAKDASLGDGPQDDLELPARQVDVDARLRGSRNVKSEFAL